MYLCAVFHIMPQNIHSPPSCVQEKIAICEQVTEPVAGGLTERKVVEVITPGTVAEDDF